MTHSDMLLKQMKLLTFDIIANGGLETEQQAHELDAYLELLKIEVHRVLSATFKRKITRGGLNGNEKI